MVIFSAPWLSKGENVSPQEGGMCLCFCVTREELPSANASMDYPIIQYQFYTAARAVDGGFLYRNEIKMLNTEWVQFTKQKNLHLFV